MEVEVKKFTIKDREYFFRLNFRAMIEYEKLSGKPISELNFTSMIDNSMLLYAGTKAGMLVEKLEFNNTIDEFIDLIDTEINTLSELLLGDDKIEEEDSKN